MEAISTLEAIRPFLIYGMTAIVLVGLLLGLSTLVGEHHRGQDRDIPFESGITPAGSGEPQPGVHFYLVAVMFVIFDLETIFLFAWAMAAREAGSLGFFSMLVFVAVLLLALMWLIRRGILDWSRRKGGPGCTGH